MVRLLAIWVLATGILQGPELPPLPQDLAQDAALQAAVTAVEQAADAEQRLAAAQALLAALSGAEPAQHAAYLMACDGAGVLPAELDLRAAWRSLAAGWPGAGAAVLDTLRQKENADRAPLRGAVRAAGHLELGNAEIVQALGPQLDQLDTGADARRSLRRITGFDFDSWADFEGWWGAHRSHDRAAWLRAALDSSEQREIEDQRALLVLRPESALEAVQHPLPEVVLLALEAMKTLKPDTPGAAESLRAAYDREQDPVRKAMVVQLVPRFLQGQEAGSLLDLAMTGSVPSVRLEAVKALARVQPPEQARKSVVGAMSRVYGSKEGPKGDADFRRELLVTLEKVFAGAPAAEGAEEEALTTFLLRALDREAAPRVRTALYGSLGALRRPAYFAMLRPIAADEDRDTADRSSALEALTKIGVAHTRGDDLVELLHPLLSHREPDLRYRAIQCLRQVKDDRSLAQLNLRLAQEGDPSLRTELLRAYRDFGEVAAPAGLDPLLEFQPHANDYAVHRDSLIHQIGGSDLAKLDHAVAKLEQRQSWQLAQELLEAFPRAGLDEGVLLRLDRKLTEVSARWLLVGKLENGRIRQAEAMVGKLAALAEAEPAQARWSVLLARLQEKRGEVQAAFASYRSALGATPAAGPDRWSLTLDAVRLVLSQAAPAPEQAAEALALLDAAGAAPEALAEEVERLRAQLGALAPAPAVEPPAPQPEPPPVPDPAPEGGDGGSGDGGATEEGGGDPPPTGGDGGNG